MKITVGELRELVSEVNTRRIGASANYMKKERVREKLQQMIIDMVKSGAIADQHELDTFFNEFDSSNSTAVMAKDALKLVPFDVFMKMS